MSARQTQRLPVEKNQKCQKRKFQVPSYAKPKPCSPDADTQKHLDFYEHFLRITPIPNRETSYALVEMVLNKFSEMLAERTHIITKFDRPPFKMYVRIVEGDCFVRLTYRHPETKLPYVLLVRENETFLVHYLSAKKTNSDRLVYRSAPVTTNAREFRSIIIAFHEFPRTEVVRDKNEYDEVYPEDEIIE